MSINSRAELAVSKLESLLGESWSEQTERKARKIIEQAMVDAVHEACSASKSAISQCCSADQDLAHKLNDEIQRSRDVLVANLNSLR
jgi:hypothetical protein